MGTVVFTVPATGNWAVKGVFGEQVQSQIVTLSDSQKDVTVSLAFDVAVLTVISPVGTNLTLSNGTTSIQKISTGTDQFMLSKMGQWTVSGTLEGYTILPQTVNVSAGGEYSVQLQIAIAVLTVTAPVGTTVKVMGGGQTNEQAATSGTATFNLTALDTYSVSGTLNDLTTNTVQVNVTEFTDYTATLTITAATIIVSTLDGVNVTATTSGKTLTGVSQDGNVVFTTQTLGEYQISGVLSGYTFPGTSVNVQSYEEYNAELYPSYATLTVTARDGTEVQVVGSSGTPTYDGVVSGTDVQIPVYVLGEYNVSGTWNGLNSDTQTVQIQDFASYSVSLTIWSATITVTTIAPVTVTAVNGDIQLSQATQNGQTVFYVQQTGTWTLSTQYDTQTASDTVDVSAETDYPVTLRVPSIVPTVVTGSTVTCTQSETVLTKTSQSGQVRFYPPTMGEWTLQATFNEQISNTVIVDVQANQDYPLLLDYEFATITVTTTAGLEVTAQNGEIIITQTATDGTAVFEVATMGEWTLSVTIDGEVISQTVTVSDTINYDVVLRASGLSYAGEIEPLPDLAFSAGVASNAQYAIFAGGRGRLPSDVFSTVKAYNQFLTQLTAAQLPSGRYGIGSIYLSPYCIFGGGNTASGYSRLCVAYDNDLSQIIMEHLTDSRANCATAKVGNYALFAGGNGYSSSGSLSTVEAYNSELTKTMVQDLSKSRISLAGASVGGYALFAGGRPSSGNSYNIVDVYNENLTRTTGEPLSVARYSLVGGELPLYALFGGGIRYSGGDSDAVDYYDSNLTKGLATNLTSAGMSSGATGNNYVVFWNGSFELNAYDENLSQSISGGASGTAYEGTFQGANLLINARSKMVYFISY